MRPQPLVAVTDVEASSRWYQRLLDCESEHGGREYERLVVNGQLVMQLHSFEVEHDHGQIGNREDRPYGNGVLLWFEVDDFDAVMERAAGGLGNKPLMVLTAGKQAEAIRQGGLSTKDAAEFERIWVEDLQMRLVGLSSRGERILLADSGHDVPAERPDAIVRASAASGGD